MDLSSPKSLLIVWHSRTGAARQMAEAARDGARAIIRELHAEEQLDIVMKPAQDTQAGDLLRASGFIFCAPENLAALSGAMKEFFDRTYYSVLDQLNGRPYVVMVSAGTDGGSAVRQTERICTGWRLQAAAPALIVRSGAQTAEQIAASKDIKPEDRASCETLGGTLAALLA